MLDRDAPDDSDHATKVVAVVNRLIKETYFPTQIYFVDLHEKDRLNAALKPAIYACRDRDPEGIVRSNARDARSWHSETNLAEDQAFAELVGLIKQTVGRIYDDLRYDPACAARLTNLWANINPRHGYNRSHIHPNSLWSGVYYVQAPPQSGRIVFRDPRHAAHMVAPFYPKGERNRELWSEVYFEPIEGRLILFPAWLVHEVEPNASPLEPPLDDRISISFNLGQEPPADQAVMAGPP